MNSTQKIRVARKAQERMRTAKMEAAAETARHLYADERQARMGKKFTSGMRAATILLAERYDAIREQLLESGSYKRLDAACKSDRLVLTTDSLSWDAILGLPGYVLQKERRLREKAYRFARPIRGTGSIGEITVEHHRTAGWFPHFRITVVPRDGTGLQYDDLRSLLEILPNFAISILEIAWDFPVDCGVDLEFVRQFGLFGRTWMEAWTRYHAKWGGTGSKIVRAYMKWETFEFRVELELHRGFLRKNGVLDVFDFGKLTKALIPHHIWFGKLSEAKVGLAVRRNGMTKVEQEIVIRRTNRIAATSLWHALRYLHQAGRLENVRQRLLIQNPEMNRTIREALEKMLSQWPSQPAALKVKP